MPKTIARIPATKLMENITLTVRITGVWRWKARLHVAKALLRLAARIAGTGIEITTDA